MYVTKKQMDRFDSIVHEFLRKNRKSISYIAEKVGCSPSTLWRYRNRLNSFEKMPLDVLCSCLRIANASNENIRYILGLPTGSHDDN